MLLTVEELRTHVETPLPDEAVQRLLDSAEDAITGYIGAPGQRTELIYVSGFAGMPDRMAWQTSTRYIFPSQRIGSIVSITESLGTNVVTTLDATDYRIWDQGLFIERLGTGMNPYGAWIGVVTLVYMPIADLNERKRVQIALVELEINHRPGVTMAAVGSVVERYPLATGDYREIRLSILGSLRAPTVTVA